MILMQIIEGIDLRTLPLSTALIVAIIYLWKSYQASMERALTREHEFYAKILEALKELKSSIDLLHEDIKDMRDGGDR